MLNFKVFISVSFLFLLSCNNASQKEVAVLEIRIEKDTPPVYAKRFTFGRTNGYKTLYIFGSQNSADTTAVFILYPKTQAKPDLIKNAFYVATPVSHVACMGTVYSTMLQKLNLLQTIVAIENVDYYNNAFIIEGVKQSKIKELSKGPEINVEQTLLLHPDLIITFGMGDPKKDMNDKVLNAGIPAAISLDHLEETPLARAEWIKFVAAFFDKDKLADSLFKITEANYKVLKLITDSLTVKPTVFTDIKYGDAWYMPGGNSYIANLLADAGANYIWKDQKQTGSIPLNFETVYTKAKDADYWINIYMVNSKKELLGYENRYNLFNAFKTGNIYNNNKIANAKNYSIYWEEGICNPDEVLKDLIKIFHPESSTQHQLKYYKKIE